MRIRRLIAGLGVGVLVVLGTASLAGAQEGTDSEPQFKDEAAEECYSILAEGGTADDCQQSPNPILPSANEILWGTAAFLVLVGVMWKFGLPGVRNMMQAREDRIRGDLERSESAKVEAEEVLEQYRAQLADARNEAARIIDEARQSAEEVRRELIARAEADAAAVRTRADEDTRLATERAMADLQARVGELSIQLAEKIVESNLDRATQMRLVESYISEVGSN